MFCPSVGHGKKQVLDGCLEYSGIGRTKANAGRIDNQVVDVKKSLALTESSTIGRHQHLTISLVRREW